MDLGHWTAPEGYRVEHRRRRLSLERPRPIPSVPPRGQDAHDLRYWDSWINHPEFALTPFALVQAHRLAELGYPQQQVDLHEGLREGDGHLRNLLEHRRRVVANKPTVFNAGDSTDEAQLGARVLQFAMGRLATKEAFDHLLCANGDGFAGVEMDWGILLIDGRPWIVPTQLTLVPARRFRIGVMGMIPVDGDEGTVRLEDLRLYRLVESPQGHPLRPGKWITLRRQKNHVARGGLMRTAAPLAMAKRYSARDWIVLCQRFGLPWPIVKYKHDADDETLATAEKIIKHLGSDGGAIVDSELELELKDVKTRDPVQDRHIAYCNNEMSKLINGSTLRNDNAGSGGASYGLGNVHDAVAWDEVRGDGEWLAEAIDQQVCEPFFRFNSLKATPAKCQIMVEPDLGPAEFVSLAVKAKNELGIDVSINQVQQRTGLRAPLNDADKAPGMQVDSFPAPAGGPP